MSYDINHCRFSGRIIDLKRIETKTGTPMAGIKIQCWKEQIRGVAFNDVAEEMLQGFSEGDRIEIAGKLQSSSWEHEGKKYRNFQIVIEEIGPDIDETHTSSPDGYIEDTPRVADEHDYSGGPF